MLAHLASAMHYLLTLQAAGEASRQCVRLLPRHIQVVLTLGVALARPRLGVFLNHPVTCDPSVPPLPKLRRLLWLGLAPT